MVQIDARSYDEAVAVDRSDRIHRFANGSWSEVGGALVHVSIGTDGSMWGVNAANNVYRRTATGGWQQVADDLTITQIDGRTYGEATAVDNGDRIYRTS